MLGNPLNMRLDRVLHYFRIGRARSDNSESFQVRQLKKGVENLAVWDSRTKLLVFMGL